MSVYWLNPPRAHIVKWANARWPGKCFYTWKLSRLRALWHATNKKGGNYDRTAKTRF